MTLFPVCLWIFLQSTVLDDTVSSVLVDIMWYTALSDIISSVFVDISAVHSAG